MTEELASSFEDHNSHSQDGTNANGSSNLGEGTLCTPARAVLASHGQATVEPVLDSEEAAALLHAGDDQGEARGAKPSSQDDSAGQDHPKGGLSQDRFFLIEPFRTLGRKGQSQQLLWNVGVPDGI
jgi:hypothetical protein